MLISGALGLAQTATAYQACAPLLPWPIARQQGELLLQSAPEHAPRTLAALTDASEVIVVGRIASQVCRVDTSVVPMVNSKFTVVVESALRGSTSGAMLSILIRGTGRVITADGRSLQAEFEAFEAPQVGDRFLLFLTRDAVEHDAFRISEWGHGLFRVTDLGTIRSPWRALVTSDRGAQEDVYGQVEGKKKADVLAEVARIIGL